MVQFEKGTFAYDFHYLSGKDSALVTLATDDGMARVIVSPKYQGKVFTSTAENVAGKSLGFVNYKVLDSDVVDEHMNGYGGENRFWLGPEGGKYSVYFAPGTTQVYDNWHTPKPIDTEPWEVVSQSSKEVRLVKEMEVLNYLGTRMKLRADRAVTLIEPADVASIFRMKIPEGVKILAYKTDNAIVNLNDFEWTTETGTICIWILDMFNPAPQAVTIIPFNEGSEPEMRVVVTSDYFGEIPTDRLKIKEGLIYLRTDGLFRSKLGLNVKRTKAIAGNYDPDSNRLTITTFDVDKEATYLNQEWNPDKNPLEGDALNAYNDGPLEDGSIMGPFLELESVSPAAFLKPMEKLSHRHEVYHFIGEEAGLSRITQELFGVRINEIKTIF